MISREIICVEPSWARQRLGWLSLKIKRLDHRFLDYTMQPKIAEAQKHLKCASLYMMQVSTEVYMEENSKENSQQYKHIHLHSNIWPKLRKMLMPQKLKKLGRDQQADLIKNIWTKEEVEIMRSRPKLKQLLPWGIICEWHGFATHSWLT